MSAPFRSRLYLLSISYPHDGVAIRGICLIV